MKYIITESQYKNLLSEDINSDNKVINELKKRINSKIEKFTSENKTNLDKSSKILDAYSIINQFKSYLINQAPTLLQQMKTGKGGDVFVNNAYSELYKIIQNTLNDLGWAKRQLIKTMSPKKDILLKQMKSKDITNYIQTFKEILDAAFQIGWMDETKSYNNNLDKWSNSLYSWVDTNQNKIKENFVNLIVNSVYK